MAQSTSTLEPIESSGTRRRDEILVDPAIAAIIQNPSRPMGWVPYVEPPAEMPGWTGFLARVRSVYGLLHEGVEYSLALRARYGDVYKAPFLGGSVVAVWDLDEVHKMLKNDDQVWSAAMGWDAFAFRGIDAHSKNAGSLLSRDFDDHRAARKLVQPAFTLSALKGYLDVAEGSFTRAIAEWRAAGRVDFKREIRTLLARVASKIFTGIEDPAQIALLDVALSDFWHGMMSLSRNPRLSKKFRRAQQGFETLRTSFLALVPERRARGGDDLFSRMCQVEDRDGLSDEELVRIFLTIMFGAFDTTSLGMASMGYLLAKHPAWQERLRGEARAAGDRLDVANMRELKLHEWAWKETLRLMPVTGFGPRRALRDVEIGGYRVRAGTFAGAMFGTLGRHPKWWKDASKFDPERFSPERAEDKQHPGLFNPFGAGAHSCIGMQLANFEMKVFWHAMLRACRFTLEKDYVARHTYSPLGCVSGDVSLALRPLAP